MTNSRVYDRPAVYQIKVNGRLDSRWKEWFDGLTINPQGNCECLLIGPVPDQAALHGLLAKIRDLGLPILMVKRIVEGCEGQNTNHELQSRPQHTTRAGQHAPGCPDKGGRHLSNAPDCWVCEIWLSPLDPGPAW